MWQRLSKAFEAVGRWRISVRRRIPPLKAGDPAQPDAMGGRAWMAFLEAERLFRVWGPLEDSPWGPFHAVTLFAALGRLKGSEIGPEPSSIPSLPAGAGPPPAWATGDAWILADLPGPRSVALAAWLMERVPVQPVCTFDNWPHPKGVIRPEKTLAALLFHATRVDRLRSRLAVGSPPLWICDRERLWVRRGIPEEFDNRYYLDDSILPGPALLRREGIWKLIYVTEEPGAAETEDLTPYFRSLATEGLMLLTIDTASDPTLRAPRPFVSRTMLPFSYSSAGFWRSAAGGFGELVPDPSSSGG